jgi:hypothetical protein
MPHPDRKGLLRRAAEASKKHGRGILVIEGRDVPHYGFLDELQRSLADEAEATTILMAAEEAVNFYDPTTEAVVIDERTEGIFVLIVGAAETRVVGEVFRTRARWSEAAALFRQANARRARGKPDEPTIDGSEDDKRCTRVALRSLGVSEGQGGVRTASGAERPSLSPQGSRPLEDLRRGVIGRDLG